MEDWVFEVNRFGLWVVGPEMQDGAINVVGIGRTCEEAYEMAKRSLSNGSK
jgi:hypothetical protein